MVLIKSLSVNNLAISHPVFTSSFPVSQSQNPRRSVATTAVLLNRAEKI